MTLVRYEPWSFVSRLHRDLDTLLDSAPADVAAARSVAIVPRVDVHEEPQRYVLRCDLPGVQPSDIEVTTDKGVLALRAERRATNGATTESGSTRVERNYGTYQRHFTLPEDAVLDAIDAKYAQGVLELVIPKQTKAEPRRITVAAA